VRLLDADLKAGLTEAEAKRRLEKFGPNVLPQHRGTPAWRKLLLQFHQPLVYILLVAAGVTAFLGEWIDSSVILGVVMVNAIVGFLQETKAEKAIEGARADAPSATPSAPTFAHPPAHHADRTRDTDHLDWRACPLPVAFGVRQSGRGSNGNR
jgi:magnesium-transporting ATPase (P-type)